MRGKIVLASLVLSLSGVAASAQYQPSAPTQKDVYCTGTITNESVPHDTYVITGEGSNYKITFQDGDYVYLNKGASEGVKVGDEFSVIRSVSDPTETEWAKWQFDIIRKLGTWWEDEGRVRVVVAQPNTSIAQVEKACGYVQRGDVILPFKERPTPPLKSEANFDRFAPFSGKATAMVMIGKGFQVELGTNDIFFINLGSQQGVRVGDYFRIFRYTGTQHETAYQTKNFAFDAGTADAVYGRQYGFGSVPAKWKWDNTPREVIGEGIVLRTGTNSATVLTTFALREFFVGDYVELE
ncbi:MAG: hypothetical protein WA192_06225 [Candidatus Acidiferrales bacterium]